MFKTLFEKKTSKPKEQSFEKWRSLNIYFSEEEISFKKIINLYNESNFKEFRNKITDHRDYQNAGDVLANFLNVINNEHIIKAELVIEKLKKHIKKYFSEEGVEYKFSNFYGDSVKSFMDILRNNYET